MAEGSRARVDPVHENTGGELRTSTGNVQSDGVIPGRTVDATDELETSWKQRNLLCLGKCFVSNLEPGMADLSHQMEEGREAIGAC